MRKFDRLCPIAWYIGSIFARSRKAKAVSLEDLAKRISYSQQTLSRFEQGQCSLDLTLIMRLEETLQISYPAYRPPISYFGFLGFTADENAMLFRTKQTIKKIKKELLHSEARREIEKSLLSLRFIPLRGKIE